MRNLFWNWIISALALFLAIWILPGVWVTQWYHVLWIAPLFGLLNVIVSALARILAWVAFPVNLVTLGCFGFLLSFFGYAVAVKSLSAQPTFPLRLEEGHSLYWAIALAIFMALFSSLLNMVLPGKSSRRQ